MSTRERPPVSTRNHPPTILLGVTGCVAAYKSCELVREFQRAGARVKVVMTPMGAEFVTPATFQALTREEVALAPVNDPSQPIHHISLAREADVFLIAPATANTLNKLANGVADNLLTTTALATEAPLLIAPAMNAHMWRNDATQKAVNALHTRGIEVLEPEAGYLACGEMGEGRLAPLPEIVERTLASLARARDLEGRRILVTAGPTREHLDPARFLSNPSSGRTGYAIAAEAARRGAEVVLVSGPTELPDPFGCTVVRITSAAQMLDACELHFRGMSAAIFTAAVADFRPAKRSEHKLKKAAWLPAQHDATQPAEGAPDASYQLSLTRTPDILATLAARKGRAFIVGFAAETDDVLAAAREKLVQKNADLIIANDISDPALGFASSNNRWHFVTAEGTQATDTLSKTALARLLCDRIAQNAAS
ncbi:MAG: bifunctional phosphopantothenoylcysteine decarboxylase/phosphopantothenate--cysteine ligase CoaBC [Coriobacteriales bacterium]|nr:bifunctional phosphopantothenoylcysteine decarboxylase/phosphopantothenate--cysteine ligase CoaBC [Coriobacteriales bacterium]